MPPHWSASQIYHHEWTTDGAAHKTPVFLVIICSTVRNNTIEH